jgi:hypothetical protein
MIFRLKSNFWTDLLNHILNSEIMFRFSFIRYLTFLLRSNAVEIFFFIRSFDIENRIMDRPKILTSILLYFHIIVLSSALTSANIQMLGRWCCPNSAEYGKCRDWMLALNQTSSAAQNRVVLECVLATDKYDCFKKIFEDKADLMTADAGEVYTAGKYYNLLPIATESYYGGGPTQPTYTDTYAVAVVKRGSGITISNLKVR